MKFNSGSLFSPKVNSFTNGVYALRPIPQGQMDAISNLGEFLQNSGY
ncbi:hypothetical protein [Sphingobacterium sp.]|nr:hypothetical protein [Sphingobacterium sp.]